VGARIAVQGVALRAESTEPWTHWPPMLDERTGRCRPSARRLTLVSEAAEGCVGVNLTLPDALHCHGDPTDVCCHANPALPKQGTVAVAVGMYLGTSPLWPEGEVDDIAVEYFCTLPSQSVGAPGHP
jgi:hypothetical protein